MEQWKLDFIKKHPLPTFTHVQGTYCADGKPVMRTPSMGPTVCIPEEIPLNRVPENVIGAYCALNNLMYGNFCMVYEYYPKMAKKCTTIKFKDLGVTEFSIEPHQIIFKDDNLQVVGVELSNEVILIAASGIKDQINNSG